MPEVTQITVKGTSYDIRDSRVTQRSIPSGGTAGQILKKNSASNYDVSWVTPNFLTDAPSDNKYYLRCNGSWVELTSLDSEVF